MAPSSTDPTRPAAASTPQTGLGVWTHRLGGLAYALWGLWHLPVVTSLWAFAQAQPPAVTPRLEQGAFHILAFALCAIGVGLILNWRNSRTGYWLNLAAITWTEIGLFALIVPALPRIPLSFWVGPALYVLAAGLTTVGLFARPTRP